MSFLQAKHEHQITLVGSKPRISRKFLLKVNNLGMIRSIQIILVITLYMIVDSLKAIQDEQNFILENYGHICCP